MGRGFNGLRRGDGEVGEGKGEGGGGTSFYFAKCFVVRILFNVGYIL
jgi:hypothetical protein